MRPAKVGPEAVGDALFSTFRMHGYAGSSLKQLGAACGLNTASLYHRFPDGKADMALAALGRAGEVFTGMVLAPLRAAGEPSERLAASALGVRRFYDGGALACLLGVLTLSDAPQTVLDAVRATFALWTSSLAAVLGEAGASDARAEAEDRIAAIQGALVLARGGAGAAAFDRATARLGSAP